ncbi:hypothetical protein NECAME_13133 [Necator americanus]|uniref:Spectrin repeat-containing domain protein n=1 Tax=Necator americanus TaxID=51031 RepID=W2SWP9_NECAM|nr:hypothetical protein NECAME_13133 [Necator americanus]ETN74189.1 hypothetical protein NECAME_13133 [Necator americanus]
MSFVYSAAIYSPGEGKTVKNLEVVHIFRFFRYLVNRTKKNVHFFETTNFFSFIDEARGWRGEISSSRSAINFDELHTKEPTMPQYEVRVRVPRANGTPAGAAPSPRNDDDDFANETLFFERNRIKQLQDERVHIQKKTFTKWCNSFLNRVGYRKYLYCFSITYIYDFQARLEVVDLFVDFGDGVLLMKLLEIISGEKLGKPNRGRMRVQKIENLNKSLDFLKRKRIQLENIGAEDILDRNERLILGLIWTIILRFQIDTIVIEDEEERGERKHAKDALLLWCQRKTAGYPNVRVENFTTSWRNGLAFNALIHAHRPELLNFNALNPNDHIGNLNNAFDVAEKKLEIARLLDAEDVDTARPDEKSIITYVSLYYHHFAKQKTELTGARRVANIVGKLMNSDTMEEDYEHISSDLLKWIHETIKLLENRRFPNSLHGMREELGKFNEFRTVEKPPKYKEKGELEALFFTIQTKRKAMSRKQYAPPQGLSMYDVESAWEKLDRAENDRQLAIIAELQRQERLEQVAQRFHKKANLRESWLRNVQVVLEEMDHGRTATEVEKSLKKQQAIANDILAREERFKLLTSMCADLCNERYHESDKIRARERDIIERYVRYPRPENIMTCLCYRTTVNAQGTWLTNVTNQANRYIRSKGEQYDVLQRKLDDVTAQYYSLVDLCRLRRANLDKARSLYQFVQDHEEELSWLGEKEHLCRRALASGDVAAVQQTTLLYKNTETEMQSHWARSKDMMAAGERLIENGQSREDIQRRIQAMQEGWERLRAAHQALGQWLSEAKQAQQYFQDANEAESWIREKMPLVKSDDLGRDEGAAESLLQRHARLEEEIHAYRTSTSTSSFRADIVRLEEMSQQLANSSFHTATTSSQETEEVTVPQIEMLYKYEGNGMTVVKGEVLALLEQSTPEWWRVLKQDGTEGFVPANYCRKVPGETVTVTQTTTTLKNHTDVVDSRRAIVDRQKMISSDYRQLNSLAEVRRRLLSDNIKLMRFYRECDEFEGWARETEAALADEPTVEHVKAFRRKFDRLEADMKANGGTQLRHINIMADELISEGHSQSRQIEARQRKVNALWAELERLRAQRAAKLETTERVADFDSSCDDAREWMQGKFDLLDRNPNDLKSLQNLERDLKPLEDKIHYLEKLAAEKQRRLSGKIAELRALHTELLRRAREKIKIAEQSQGQEMFESALRDVFNWIDRTKKALAENVRALDVQQAEDLLKKHYELGEQIKDKKYEDSVESVENLLKRHRDLEAKLDAQEGRLAAFSKNADELIKNRHSESAFIDARRADVLTRRAAVRRLAAERRTRLEASLEYQNMKRDAEEMISWIHEKKKLANDDSHRDLTSIANKLLKHEAFEAEVGANGPRVAQINRVGSALIAQKHYESANVDRLLKRLNAEWLELGDAVARKGEKLRQASDQKGLNRILEDAHAKLDELETALKSDEHGSDLRAVKDLIQKHAVLEQEMGIYEKKVSFSNAKQRFYKNAPKRLTEIYKKGRKMAEQGHFDADRINYTVAALLKRFEDLGGPASARRAALEESRKWHQLAFDVDCELQWIAEKKPIASSEDTGRNLTEALNMVKKQDQLEAEVHQHSSNIEATIAQGEALIRSGHKAAPQIKAKCEQLADAWRNLTQLVKRRRQVVDWGVKEQQYMFDAAEKRAALESNNYGQDEDAAQKLLAKHRALQKDMQTYRQWLDKLAIKCSELVDSHRPNVERFAIRQKDLETEFDRLSRLGSETSFLVENVIDGGNYCLFVAEERRRALEDTVHLFEYMRESADLEQWINEQLQTAMSEEYGDDYEHFKELQSRFEEFKQSVRTGSERFVSCEAAANALLRRNPPFGRDILKKQEKLRSVWTLLLDYIESRESKLAAAEELHRFNQDVLEHEEWVVDKRTNMSRDKGRNIQQQEANQILTLIASKRATLRQLAVGGSVADVEGQQKRLDTFAKALSTLDERTKALDRTANELIANNHMEKNNIEVSKKKKPPLKHTILDSLKKLEESWKELSKAAELRNECLDKSYKLHKYIDQVKKAEQWAAQLRNKMTSYQVPKTTAEAEQLIAQHAERRAEIDGRQKPPLKHTILDSLKKLEESWKELSQAAELRNECLDKSYKLHKYIDQVKKAEQWAAQLRNKMTSYQVPKTTAEAEQLIAQHAERRAEIDGRQLLIKSHDAFEETIKKQGEKLVRLKSDAEKLIGSDNEYRGDVQARCEEVLQRHEAMLETSSNRRGLLCDSKKYHEFIRTCGELITWINAKLQLAYDESYLDPTNLRAKLQKHLAFDSELTENEKRLVAVEAQGEQLIKEKHFMSEQVRAQLGELRSGWDELRTKSALKTNRLREAYEAHTLQRKVEDMERWLDRVTELTSEDHGRDLLSVEHLMKKLDALDAEIRVRNLSRIYLKKERNLRFQGRADAVTDLIQKAREIKTMGSPTSDAILGAAEQVQARYASLNEPVAIRRENLRDAHALYEWTACAEEELEWLADKLPLARSQECGDSLHAAHSLQKKHAALEKELESRQAGIQEIESKGYAMIRAKHFASPQIEKTIDTLSSALLSIKDAASVRRARLQQAVDSHEYYTEVAEAEQWIRDQMPVATNQETGRDQVAAEGYLRRLTALDKEVAKFKDEIERLRVRCDALQEHQNANQIAARQVKLETAYSDLVKECNRRRTQLVDAGRYHRFVRQVDDLSDWLHDKEHLASSEDYGRDLEDCVQLTEKFETVVRELAAAGERVAGVQRAQEELLRSGHPYAASIRAKGTDLHSLWTSVNEAATERQQALAGARQVHRFDQEADETLNWLGVSNVSGKMFRMLQIILIISGDDWRHVDTVENAESQLRDFDDFLVTLDAQADRCEMVKRLTLIEQSFSRLRKKEIERTRIAEEDQKRRDTIKVVEKGQILANRRQERERRKTQEISLLRPSPNEDYTSQTLPKKIERVERSKTATIGENVVVGGPSTMVTSGVNAPVVSGAEVDMRKTPSFTTRRGHSMSRNSTSRWEDMGAIDMRGFVDRKQDLQSGGKKATIRSWKNYYTILCGQLMCFFKDEAAFYDNLAAAAPVYIYGARCEPFPEYIKRKHAFRLATQDGAEYVFACSDERQMLEWVAKVKFHAGLAPSNQLKSYNYHGGVSTSFTYGPTATIRTPSATNGYMETLAYQEHSTSTYTRETPPHRDSRVSESVEFISWVENNQPHGRQTPTLPTTPSSHHDNDSLKSESELFY